jgi:hypothetical protein
MKIISLMVDVEIEVPGGKGKKFLPCHRFQTTS